MKTETDGGRGAASGAAVPRVSGTDSAAVRSAFFIAGGPGSGPLDMQRWCRAALSACPVKKPKVAYIGTASGDSKPFFAFIRAAILKAGGGEVELLRLASKKADASAARGYLDACDAVFITGGEVWDGMYWLAYHGIDSCLKELFAKGRLFFGMSAGSIMMGEHWVKWEKEDDDSTASLFDCLGLVPHTFDTHAEDEDWKELKCGLRLMGPGAVGHGIPSGGMVRADSAGGLFDIEKRLLVFQNDAGRVVQKEP